MLQKQMITLKLISLPRIGGEDDTDSRFFQTNHCNRYPNSQFTRIHLKAISLMQSYLFFLNIAKYQEKVAETHKELELLETSIRTYKNDVDAMTTEIKHLMDMLLVKAKELFEKMEENKFEVLDLVKNIYKDYFYVMRESGR